MKENELHMDTRLNIPVVSYCIVNFFSILENLWQVLESGELSEGSYISEEISAALTGWVSGVRGSHLISHCKNGWPAFLHRPGGYYMPAKGFHTFPVSG